MGKSPPDICPVCGAAVPRSARACPECGADDTAGWNESGAVYDGLDLPDDRFNYDEYVQREFGGAKKPSARSKAIWIWLGIIGFVLAVLLLGSRL